MTEIIILKEKKQIRVFTEDLGNGVELELVQIPSGRFIMGASESEKDSRNSERPQHEVTISSFLMGRYPITQEQWREIANRTDRKKDRDLEADPSRFKEDPPQPPLKSGEKAKTRWQRPVERVSWYDAVEFCHRLSKLTGRSYQLPSEAQWEYACRGVTNYQPSVTGEQSRIREWNEKYHQPFHFGETITSDLANYRGTEIYTDEQKGVYRKETTPVGMFSPNAFGLYDMHGNVWEWCADTWHENYKGAPTDGSAWITGKDETGVLRGGAWNTYPYNCRSAFRNNKTRANDYGSRGLRVMCVFGRTS